MENYEIGSAPSGYRMLTDAQLEEIHLASLEILRRTGTRIYDEEALEVLHGAGCIITDGNLVRFPAAVVEDALQSAPSRIALCGRDGKASVRLEGHRTYFGTGSDLPFTRDLETGERRKSLLSDVQKMTRLVDSLPNIDFTMSMALPSDVPVATSDRYSFLAMVENTTKPIVITAWDDEGLADIIAMAETVVGGPEEHILKPLILAYVEPSSPLQHSKEAVRKLMLLADKGLPVVYASGTVGGASVPITAAGIMALTNAEALSGLVISQNRRRGAPFVLGSGSGPMDMRTMVGTYGGPESLLHDMGMAELAHHYYKLPAWGFAGCSDSKLPDMQAGIESALWILWMALAGSNLVHDVGYVESGLTYSCEMIVASDEVIGYVRRLMRGVEVSPETLAVDVVDAVGPGGHFLDTEHTYTHFRDMWSPRIFDKRGFQDWIDAGEPTAVKTARDIARDMVASHKPALLPESTVKALREIIEEADARAGV